MLLTLFARNLHNALFDYFVIFVIMHFNSQFIVSENVPLTLFHVVTWSSTRLKMSSHAFNVSMSKMSDIITNGVDGETASTTTSQY